MILYEAAIVFPTEHNLSLTVDINRCVDKPYEGQPFCTKVQNYPELKNLENALSKFEIFFGEDLAPPKLANRMGTFSAPEEQSLCDSEERIIFPQTAESKDSNWLLIVNEKNYKQGVRIEQCL